MAAIIGYGRYLKKSLKNKAPIKKVNTPNINAEVLWVAPDFILRAVLINTAVVGSHHKIPEPRFDIQSQNTSLFLSNFSFFILLAALAEIKVSNTEIIATTKAVIKIVFKSKNTSFNEEISTWKNGIWKTWKVKFGNTSDNNKTLGTYPYEDKNQKTIHQIAKNITPGKFGNILFVRSKKRSHDKNTTTETRWISLICWNKVIILRYTSFCISIPSAGLLSHKAGKSCDKKMIIQTDIINPCNVLDGIKIIYFVIRR